MSEFKREARYLVIKKKELHTVPEDLLVQFIHAFGEISPYLDGRSYVVVEDDWPEYETVWKMIEDRVNSM